jgi:hypothetical protein
MNAMALETLAVAAHWSLPLSSSALQVCVLYLACALAATTCLVAADRADGHLRAPGDEAETGDGEPPRDPPETTARPSGNPGSHRDEERLASHSRIGWTAEAPCPGNSQAELSRLGLLMPSIDDPEPRSLA